MYRRQLMIGAPAIWLGTQVVAAPNQKAVDELVAELMRCLEEMHGGKWACKHDHEMLMMRRL